ncbi:MAG: hypothetical protein CMO26_12710 [Thiotrichales bacterium]|nr:hypothetical protein [Thiotrichales bacterium]
MLWHIKNFFVHAKFEQGWFGLLTWSLVYLIALGRSVRASALGDPLGITVSGALAGLGATALFDSVVDVRTSSLMVGLILTLALFGTEARSNRILMDRTPCRSPENSAGEVPA